MAVWLLHGVTWTGGEIVSPDEPVTAFPPPAGAKQHNALEAHTVLPSPPPGGEGLGVGGRVLETETGARTPARAAPRYESPRPALTPNPSPASGRGEARVPGGDAAPQTLPIDDLLAVVFELEDPAVLADPDRAYAAALAHHEITLAWARAGDFAPSAFGLAHRTLDDLRAAVAAEAAGLRAALRAVGGAAEYVLKAKPDPAGPAPAPAPRPATGRGYLAAAAAARAGRRSRSEVVSTALTDARAALLAIARDATPWTPRGEGAEAAYGATLLVSRAEAPAFEAACAEAARTLADAGIVLEVTGPWPCAVFARAAIEAARPAAAA